jgi:hypothetical protein
MRERRAQKHVIPGSETMISTSRRRLLTAGAALAGASALGFPAISYGQADKIKIGHLTPLTGFLGALGAYAQLGLRMAQEEINGAGGVRRRDLPGPGAPLADGPCVSQTDPVGVSLQPRLSAAFRLERGGISCGSKLSPRCLWP